MNQLRVLHVAPVNVAGVPFLMMDMQRQFGAKTRLVTLHENTLTFPEDICLQLPLPRNWLANAWRRVKSYSVANATPLAGTNTPTHIFKSRNPVEGFYFALMDQMRKETVLDSIRKYELDLFDIVHYDGGMDFFRDSRIAKEWKRMGKKIVCHYMGSDLRVRGIIPEMDSLSDLNLTNESDHLLLHPDIHYIFIPFDTSLIGERRTISDTIRIVHSPSKRAFKGTELILPIIERLNKIRKFEFLLLENMPHNKVVELKRTCDIAIEQIGNLGGTGYGRNSLETLALGIPTVTEMTEDYLEWLPENPFVLANKETLLDVLINLIDDLDLRKQTGRDGQLWVRKYHSYESVNNRLLDLYRSHNLI